MRIRFLSILAALLLPFAALAQGQPNTILVLDGSGSMWGQIDGKAKITIAQEVVGDLLNTLPADQNLGLTVYGHRTKGDCSDIETIVPPGPDTRAAILKAVNAISPKGKTPMTDAVIAAAEALRFTEEAATVILVSDGIETCNPDPCAAARILEQTGVNFTAHVVGFNVDDPEALAQMQCLAAETGGKFLTADNAATLAEALTEVAAVPEPEPAPVAIQISFQAHLGKADGPLITENIVWDITDGTNSITGVLTDASPQATLFPGTYTATVTRTTDEVFAEAEFFVEKLEKTVIAVLPAVELKAVIEASATAPIGSAIDVVWTADQGTKDYISIAKPDASASTYATYSFTKGTSPTRVTLPLEPGDYELRYIRNAPGEADQVLARRALTAIEIAVTLEANAQVAAGSVLKITHDGPAYARDYISAARSDDPASKYLTYTFAKDDNPVGVIMPLEPGDYQLRYVANGSPDRVLGQRNVTVVAVETALEAPETAAAGSPLPVNWTGPGNPRDYISVASVDQSPSQYHAYAYTDGGNPAMVTMPLDPGAYELRYVANGSPDQVLATRPITVVAVSATLEATPEAAAGAKLPVSWAGPDNDRDYISIAKPGDPAGTYSAYAYTREGSPLKVMMPLDPGAYELRYVANGSPDQVLTTRPITVVAVAVALEAAPEAVAGSTLSVTWDGPDNDRDYLSVAVPGSDDGTYVNYRYSRDGNPSQLQMPVKPGNYEIRYVASGNPEKALATRPVTITAVTATIEAAPKAAAGSVLMVDWVGPAYDRDYIAISVPGSDGYEAYTYARDGSPARLTLPEQPGTYELRYVMDQGSTVIASRPIQVE